MSGSARATALVVCATAVPGYPPSSGVEKRMLRLIEAMQRAGAEPHVVAAGDVGEERIAALGRRGIRLEAVDAPVRTLGGRLRQQAARRPHPRAPALARRVAELCEERPRPAFVQIEGTQNARYARIDGVPTVLSTHSVDSERIATIARTERAGTIGWVKQWNRWHSMRVTERHAVGGADVTLCVSEHDAERFATLARRVVVAPNGTDDELFEIPAELPDTEVVLFVGDYGYEPNALGVSRFLREGWPVVARARPRAWLRLVGRGLQGKLAADAEAAERVEIAGVVERIDRELADARAIVVPIWHGGGTLLKTLEALSCARPIAATPFGARGLGFIDRRHGLLAESAVDLGGSVVRLLADRDLSRSVAAGGRALAERYRWSVTTRPAERLYRGWVEAAPIASR